MIRICNKIFIYQKECWLVVLGFSFIRRMTNNPYNNKGLYDVCLHAMYVLVLFKIIIYIFLKIKQSSRRNETKWQSSPPDSVRPKCRNVLVFAQNESL